MSVIEGTLRDEARAWLAENWNTDQTLAEWWHKLAAAGFAFPQLPEGYGGRGLPQSAARIVAEELGRIGAVAPPGGLGQSMGAPIIMDFGTDQQQQDWVFRLSAGQESWFQFFSEPEAGSDLAGLQTRAVRDGDVWILNGQKVWTSGARTADRGMMVARTNPDVPKHKGLSYFIIDVDAPGIEIRPLKQMNGQAHFNEVFFTDVVVPHDRIVAEPNGGWMVAVATLAYERQGQGGRGGGGGIQAGSPGVKNGDLDRPLSELIQQARAEGEQAANDRNKRTAGAILQLAKDEKRTTDPTMRQRIMSMYSESEALKHSNGRARAAAQKGKQPGPEVSTAKLTMSSLSRQARDISLELMGPYGMLADDDAPYDGAFHTMALSVQSASIAGGTDEVQRNITGERVLQLPKEPQVDRDIPFNEIRGLNKR